MTFTAATDVGPLVEAIGVLLAGYAFFFEASRGSRIQASHLFNEDENVVLGATARDTRLAQEEARELIPVSVGLAAAPVIVSLIFFPVAIDILLAVDLGAPYDALKAAFITIELVWIVVAWFLFKRARSLIGRYRWIREEAESRAKSQAEAYAEQRRQKEASRRAGQELGLLLPDPPKPSET